MEFETTLEEPTTVVDEKDRFLSLKTNMEKLDRDEDTLDDKFRMLTRQQLRQEITPGDYSRVYKHLQGQKAEIEAKREEYLLELKEFLKQFSCTTSRAKEKDMEKTFNAGSQIQSVSPDNIITIKLKPAQMTEIDTTSPKTDIIKPKGVKRFLELLTKKNASK